jgi:hypothetical protein
LVQDYTSAVDMWSLGCIMAELLDMLDTLNIPASNRLIVTMMMMTG